ncbi:MAG: hypothetical protein ABIJ59_19225 [Pseudomonadota bacterium]
MTHEIKTLELARIYESQGYVEDAFNIYSSLYSEIPSNEIKAGINRMRARLKTQTENQTQKHIINQEQTYNQLGSLAQSLSPDPDSEQPLDPQPNLSSKMTILNLFEQWVTLKVLEDRLDRIKKFKNTDL